ncbi:MAG: AAA family ATPase [Solirubrobacteraceae bacterium]
MAQTDDEELDVEIVGVRFCSDDGTFAVIDALTVAGRDHEVLVGPVGHLDVGDRVRAAGRRSPHPKHGERFRVDRLESVAGDEDEAISRVLQRVPGVGPVAAERLIERFGDDLLDRLAADPRDVLRRVRGLSGVKLDEAVEHWRSEEGGRAVRLLLERHRVDAATITRVVRAMGDEPDVARLREDPYGLTARSGIGFFTADAIALALGREPDGPDRLRAAALQALRDAELDGHCHLPHADLVSRTTRLLRARGAGGADDQRPIADAVHALVEQGVVVEQDDRVATLELDEDERMVATLVADLVRAEPTLDVTLPHDPPAAQDDDGRVPTPEQWEAVRLVATRRLTILTGGPGTGKTQTMRALVQAVRDGSQDDEAPLLLCAPTGKAARRLAEATGAKATTVHRLLGFVPGSGFQHDEDDPVAEGGVLVVDEASMLSLDLAVALLRAVGPHTHVLLVGDVDQLAPVGPGRVLQDLLESGAVPAVRLTRIFRQAERSLIVRAAHRINRGEWPLAAPGSGPDGRAPGGEDRPNANDGAAPTDLPDPTGQAEPLIRDFFLLDRRDPIAIADEVLSLAVSRLPGHYGVDAVGGVQVLAAQRRGTCGVNELNRRLREALNPGGSKAVTGVGGALLRAGDRVMQTRNDHDAEVMNGELGLLVRVVGPDATVRMDDGRTLVIPVARLETWDLAYACTVHKAQGSSVPVVVIPVPAEHRHMLTRNLLYTAVTRAERACVVVADPSAVQHALGRVDGATRFTALPARVQAAMSD